MRYVIVLVVAMIQLSCGSKTFIAPEYKVKQYVNKSLVVTTFRPQAKSLLENLDMFKDMSDTTVQRMYKNSILNGSTFKNVEFHQFSSKELEKNGRQFEGKLINISCPNKTIKIGERTPDFILVIDKYIITNIFNQSGNSMTIAANHIVDFLIWDNNQAKVAVYGKLDFQGSKADDALNKFVVELFKGTSFLQK